MFEFTLCTQSECNLPTEIGPHSENLKDKDTYVMALARTDSPRLKESLKERHEACHSVTLLCDDSSMIEYHAACLHNAGRLYALFKKENGNWKKIKTNV